VTLGELVKAVRIEFDDTESPGHYRLAGSAASRTSPA
jgi:hypothetical protein